MLDSIVAAQRKAQPFAYPDGLIEVPMSPISDIGAFRTGRWQLEWFLRAVRRGVEWAIEHGAVFDFLAPPVVPVRRRSGVPDHRPDLRPGPQSRPAGSDRGFGNDRRAW